MNIVMTLLVRDEQDIIRENIEFHLAQGVTHFIATDNKSVDETTNILKEYEKRGVLHYLYEDSDNYNQSEWVTKMALMAYVKYKADWVINNDADEFWWPQTGNLKSTFERVSSEFNVIEAHRSNFVMVTNADSPFYQSMVYKEVKSVNSMGRPLPKKVSHRGTPNIKIAQGNHSVSGLGNQRTANGEIDILHFPIRSKSQFTNKIQKGGAAYERNDLLPYETGITWRELYSEYKRNNNLNEYCAQHLYDKERIKEEVRKGILVKDVRLANYLDSLYKIKNAT